MIFSYFCSEQLNFFLQPFQNQVTLYIADWLLEKLCDKFLQCSAKKSDKITTIYIKSCDKTYIIKISWFSLNTWTSQNIGNLDKQKSSLIYLAKINFVWSKRFYWHKAHWFFIQKNTHQKTLGTEPKRKVFFKVNSLWNTWKRGNKNVENLFSFRVLYINDKILECPIYFT